MKDCCYVIETFDHGYISKVISLELDNFTFDTTKSIIKAFKWDNPNKAIEYCNKIDIAKCVSRFGLLNGSIYSK